MATDPAPQGEDWYIKFFKDRHAGTLHHDQRTIKRLYTSIGITTTASDAIMDKVMSMLAGEAVLDINSGHGKRRRNQLADQLKIDNDVGDYFDYTFIEAQHPKATLFFDQVAHHWVACANARRREAEKAAAAVTNNNESDVDMTDDSSQDDDEGVVTQERPVELDVDDQPGLSEEVIIIKYHADDHAAHALHPAQGTASKYVFELRDLTTGLFVASCLNSVFRTGERAPTPGEMNMSRIRAYWAESSGELDDKVCFNYTHRPGKFDETEVSVALDGHLRLAYRLHLKDGNQVFRLYVDRE